MPTKTPPLAAALLLALGLLSAAPVWSQVRRVAVATPPRGNTRCTDVPEPDRISGNRADLRMVPGSFTIGGTHFNTNVYNGEFVAPTLYLAPGEPLRASVLNGMMPNRDQTTAQLAWTNQHYHGLVVTPLPDTGDNVTHISIPHNRAHINRFPVPDGHTQGMFWYHPHPHGISTVQVAGGLSGALMVGSILYYFPEFTGAEERTLLIRDMSFNLVKSPVLLNINGAACARLPVPPGEGQLWHIGNFGANTFVNLKLGRNQRWTLLALDGNPLMAPTEVDSLWLPPGSRAEVIVTGPARGDSVEIFSAPFAPSDTVPVRLGWLVGEGTASRHWHEPPQLGRLAEVVDTIRFLREARNVKRSTFRFTFPSDTSASVNDTIYSPTDPPVSIPWGQVQEWTIVNETDALHTFHIHQTDFLVLTVNGKPVTGEGLRDNVPIGVHSDGRGGWLGDTVVVRFVFEPIAAGPFVFHCHVLQHEDEGMMHNVCVYDPNDPNGPRKCRDMFSSGPHAGH